MSGSSMAGPAWFSESPKALWTWGGAHFGYRRGNSLFTYDGVEVGRFSGAEVFGPDGSYLGEIKRADDGDRLTTSNYKRSKVSAAFVPAQEATPSRVADDRLPTPLYCGYGEFPSPESLRVMALEVRKQLRGFAQAVRVH